MVDIGIGSWPRRRARIDPDGIALVQDEHQVSHAELADRVDALAAVLADLGVGSGDRVAHLGRNDLVTFEMLFASGRLGAIFVPLNTRLTETEISYLLDDSVPTVLVIGPGYEGVAAGAVSRSVADPVPVKFGDITLACSDRVVRSRQEHHVRPAPSNVDVALNDPAVIMYTSGTTGRPKGAVLTHGNITWNTFNQLAHLSLGSDDVAISATPLFHVLGLCQITLAVLYAGGTVVVMDKFDAGDFLARTVRHRVTAFPIASTMLAMLAEHPRWDDTDLTNVRWVVFGGAPPPDRAVQAWLDRQVTVLQGYGMTEASPGVLMAAPAGLRTHPASAGVPHFFTDLALLTTEGEIVSGPGQGELLVKGPNVFDGYWNNPEATERAFIDGWYRSGDIVRIDRDGWAHVLDRLNAVIISGCENIYPAEVENAINDLDGVLECAVVPVPDQRWGEVAVAFVVPHQGWALDEHTITDHLQGRLAKYKVPKYIAFRVALPRNALEKVHRSVLRDDARKLFS